MALDLETILRSIQTRTPSLGVNTTTPASGSGLQGLDPTGGGGASAPLASGGSGLTYNAPGMAGNTGSSIQMPNFQSTDDMGFDSQYASAYDQLQRQLASSQSDYQAANAQEQPEYDRVVKASNDQYGIDAQNLTDRMANQGLLRSGIFEKAQGDLSQSLQNRIADFNRQRTDTHTSRERSFSQLQQQIQDQIASLQSQKAAREAQKQADLARKQAQQNPNGQYQIPTGMTPGDFQNAPPGSELANNYQQILGGGPTQGMPSTNPADPAYVPGAGDTNSTWVDPNASAGAYDQRQQAAANAYLAGLYAQQNPDNVQAQVQAYLAALAAKGQ